MALHPVTGRLVQYRKLINRLEEMEKISMPQVEEVLRRAAKGAEADGEGGEEESEERCEAEETEAT